MCDSLLPLIAIFGESSWLWQGLIVNFIFSIGSIPFTSKFIKSKFRRLKRNRIKAAENELLKYCLQRLLKEKRICNEDFENQLFIIASKHQLSAKDIMEDKELFRKKLAASIVKIDMIDEKMKQNFVLEIRNNKIFFNNDEKSNAAHSKKDFNHKTGEDDSGEEEYAAYFFDEEIDGEDKKVIYKQTGIVTGIIFISLLLLYSFIQIFFRILGINGIILISTVIILILLFPILANGILHYEEFENVSKRNFYFLVIIFLFAIINFISIITTL